MLNAHSGRIEKKIVLRAPRSRVWRALTNADEFGAWFRVKLEGAFAVGKSVTGKLTHPGYEHVTMEVTVERMEAEHLFSYRWHPTRSIRTSTIRSSPRRSLSSGSKRWRTARSSPSWSLASLGFPPDGATRRSA